MCGGGGKTTTTVAVPPKSEEELGLLRRQNELLDLQLEEVKRQNEAMAEVFPFQKELLKAQTEASLLQVDLFKKSIGLFDETEAQKKIREAGEERTLAAIEGRAPVLNPQQEKFIEDIFGSERAKGQREITRFLDETAAARGLRLTDSPIAAEGARAAGELEQGLAGATARAKLDVGQAQQAFSEGVRQFQEGLRVKAAENRLALLGRGSPATGLPMFSSVTSGQALAGVQNAYNLLSQERLAQSTTKTKVDKPFWDLTASGILGSVAGVAGAAALSTARVKKAILPYDQDEYDRALAKLKATPVTRWRYLWEPDDHRPHTGPILELSPEDIKEDDRHINLLNYAGLQHAALKAVDRKVERLSGQLAAAVTARRRLPIGGAA